MKVKRAAIFVAGLGALAAWLAAAATSGSRATPPLSVAPPPNEATSAELAKEIARLHDRLRPTAAPQHDRNLFQFAAVKPAVIPPAPAVVAPPAEPAAEPVAVAPPFRLIGVAEDSGPEGPVRTAILSSAGQLWLVKDGEAVPPRYRVTRVSADAVELADVADGSIVHLALK